MKHKHAYPVLVLVTVFTAVMSFSSCKETGEHTEANDHRADSLMKALNSPELTAVNKKILDKPDDASLYNERAKIYLKLKQFEDAINDTKRSIRIDSTNAAYYLTEADVFFASNQTRNAKDVLELVVKRFPQNTEGLLKLAELLYFVKQYDPAFEKINTALKIDQHLAKAYYLKGSIYKEVGDTAKAISSLQTTIDQDNRHYGAFLDLGLIYAARKNSIALEYYNNAISINPTNPEALYAKAKLLQDLSRMDEAVATYNQILKTDSTHVFSLYNLGAIELDQKKDVKKALEYFTKAINANPKYGEAYFARGVCYQELNDKNNAYADYNMCLQLKPNYEPAIDALNSLGK